MDAETLGDLNDDREGGDVISALDEAEVARIHIGTFGELFLRPAPGFAKFAYDGPEQFGIRLSRFSFRHHLHLAHRQPILSLVYGQGRDEKSPASVARSA